MTQLPQMTDEHRGHPKEIWILFIVEMWERFSYYGMRSLLIFYMTKTFLFGDDKSYAIYGSYTALVYLTPVFGGIVADRLLGYRKAVTVGALLMAMGHFCMAIQTTPVFYLALSLLIIGNGFFKPNMSTVVGKLYKEGDPRRDGGYTIFYMGVNVGAALAPIACGLVGDRFGLHWGFTLAGFGMVTGLLVFLSAQKRFAAIADPPNPESLKRTVMPLVSKETLIYIGGAVAVALTWKLIQLPELVGWMLIILGGGMFAGVLAYSLTREHISRDRLWVALGLTAVAVVFWAFFEQAGSSMNLFADRNVNKVVLGFEVPAPVMQSINPIFIILLGPLFAWLWVALDARKLNPSIPLKFGLGIIQLGLGFIALYYGASISQEDGTVALYWLVLGYLLHTTGELCLSPVGLSMISKLAPPNMGAMMMGMWYLSIAFAQYAAGLIAQLTGVSGEEVGATAEFSAVDTVMVYGNVFGKIAIVAVVVGILTSLFAPLINKGTHGVK
ncbi:MAG: peptide MFS transporter [Candidatus Krumholzibacteria bacterium]|nr:peptide MFS transporter [Candidatus Krumholzibacteria bacterium]